MQKKCLDMLFALGVQAGYSVVGMELLATRLKLVLHRAGVRGGTGNGDQLSLPLGYMNSKPSVQGRTKH